MWMIPFPGLHPPQRNLELAIIPPVVPALRENNIFFNLNDSNETNDVASLTPTVHSASCSCSLLSLLQRALILLPDYSHVAPGTAYQGLDNAFDPCRGAILLPTNESQISS